jgi:uncharacterized membrane protein YagU involved in acid resistance
LNRNSEGDDMNTLASNAQRIVSTRTIIAGAIAGMVAGAVMAMYAMLASATFLHQGFFTPLYGIASPIVGTSAMATSMQQGVYFSLGPALVGLIVHMMWSAMFGVIFALIARAVRLHGALALVAGVTFGLAVQLVMSVIVLPLVGQGGMAGEIGLPSFTVEHLLFGLTLGLWVALRPQDIASGAPANA